MLRRLSLAILALCAFLALEGCGVVHHATAPKYGPPVFPIYPNPPEAGDQAQTVGGADGSGQEVPLSK